jgi:uncharacterized RDD family membrane protein YckC
MTDAKERVLLGLLMAKPWKRLLAWLVDQVLLSTMVLLLAYPSLDDPYLYVEMTEALLFINLVYFTLVEGTFGRSFGKWVMGITVYDENGRQVGFSKAMLRRIGLITPILGIFDASAILATSRRQRLFDVIAGTVVVDDVQAPEAIAYLRGADINKLLAKFGFVPRAPPDEKARLARTLKRMGEMRARLKVLRARGELTREEYARLEERYKARMEELKEKLGRD